MLAVSKEELEVTQGLHVGGMRVAECWQSSISELAPSFLSTQADYTYQTSAQFTEVP